ncbi:MAG TPA: MDR family MFS transporter [Actinomycetales bacterium]|nr:MDR family MFS transporter [Actinomycetales bacterium]
MTATTTAAEPPSGGQLNHRQIVTILSGLMLGMFLAALDQTIIASSIRTIADDLQGLSLQAWATTAYLITATISTPLYGKLSDIYGRKPFFLAAISIFLVGSLLSGFAWSLYSLAAFRGVQGLGAGGLFSLALAIIGDIVPPRERAKYQGYFLAVFGTSSVLGPVVGGFFAGADSILGITGWRWVFLVNLPLGIIALFVVVKVLNIPHTRRDHRIDWQGAVALVVGLVPLLLLAEQGRDWGWTSSGSLACYALGALGLVGFLLAERRAGDEALLPLRFFRIRTFGLGSLLNFVIGMGMFGGFAALPLYLQIVKGATPTESGLLLLPLTAGVMTGSITSGRAIARTGRYKWFPVAGGVLLLVGSLLMSRLGVDTSFVAASAGMLAFGLGLGFNMQPLVLAIQNSVGPRDMGVATSSATFFRQMGGTFGTAVFLSVLFSTAGGRITSAFERIAPTPEFRAALRDPAVTTDPANAPVVDMIASGGSLPPAVLDDSSFLIAMDEVLARPFRVGFADAIDVVLLIAAVVMAIALVLALFLPDLPLRESSGMALRHEEDRAAAERERQAVVTGPASDAAAVAAPTPPRSPR